MGRLKNTWLGVWWAWLWYLWLDALWESWFWPAQVATDIIDSVAGEAINILQNAWVEIASLAPISEKFISELSWVLDYTNIIEYWVAWGTGLLTWWVGKKISQWTGKVLGVESEKDDNIVGIWAWSAGALWFLWASTTALTVWAWSAWYVLGRKLWERILWEKYAKITWVVWALWATWLAWGAAPSIALWSAAVLGWGALIWKAWEEWRVRRQQKRAAKK